MGGRGDSCRAAHAAPRRVPVSPAAATASGGLTPPPQAFSLSLRPRARMFLAAFRSRSCTAPHAAHVQVRTPSGLGPSLIPQAEHTWLVGSNRPVRTNVRPCLAALYSSIAVNADQPASCTDLASRVRPSPATHKSSTHTAWLSRMIRVDSLCSQSRRASATRAWARATLIRALPRLLLPGALRLSAFCAVRSLRSARRRNLGLATLRPSDRTAKCVSPRSIPVSVPEGGSGPAAAWTTKLAKYRPAASLITVTLDGPAGSSRDQRTGTSPIFGRRSFPPAGTAKRAVRVNRIACRRSLQDRNRGGATRGPLRVPAAEAKKFRYAAVRSASACCRTTPDTSPRRARHA